jgi:hypothetical protein
MNKEEKNAKQREARRMNGNAYTKKYEKTKRGFLMRCYRNMQSRVRGIQRQKAHLYAHIDNIIPREEFYTWAMNSPDFHALFGQWEASGHDRRLTPSVDRASSLGGYSLDNMRWLTHSENSRLGAVSPRRTSAS